MSPEQIRHATDLDHRTDIWSLGVVLYELCAGSRPFAGETPSATLASIVADEPKPLRSHDPTIHPDLEAIVGRCLRKSPVFRYPTTASLAAALAPLGSERARWIARQLELNSPPPSASRAAAAEACTVSAATLATRSTATVVSAGFRHVKRTRVARAAAGLSLAVGFAVALGVTAHIRSMTAARAAGGLRELQKPALSASTAREPIVFATGANPAASTPPAFPEPAAGPSSPPPSSSRASNSATPAAFAETARTIPSRASSKGRRSADAGSAPGSSTPTTPRAPRGSIAAQPRDPLDEHY
ncbi:MAG: protein kinase [Myxococcales bacterium]|nr:protein kinase [Myxococcales bacterium]